MGAMVHQRPIPGPQDGVLDVGRSATRRLWFPTTGVPAREVVGIAWIATRHNGSPGFRSDGSMGHHWLFSKGSLPMKGIAGTGMLAAAAAAAGRESAC